jgi:hypothetical protein
VITRRDAPYRSGKQTDWIKAKSEASRAANKERWRLSVTADYFANVAAARNLSRSDAFPLASTMSSSFLRPELCTNVCFVSMCDT